MSNISKPKLALAGVTLMDSLLISLVQKQLQCHHPDRDVTLMSDSADCSIICLSVEAM